MSGYGLIGLLMVVGCSASQGDSRLHPLHDDNPLRLEATLKTLRVSEEVPGPGGPVVARLAPKSGSWDCSGQLWLLLDVMNNGEQSVLARAEVASGKQPWRANKGAVHVPAGEQRTLPVLILRGMIEGRSGESLETIFKAMRGYPGGHQQTGWRQLDASSIKGVRLEFFTDASRVECEVYGLRAATRFHLPSNRELQRAYTPATDQFGQNRTANWKLKIHSDADFATRLESETVRLATFPPLEHRSPFGGWTKGLRFESTGHFQAVKKDGIWWLADPDGWPFWSIGATGFNLEMGNTVTPGIGRWNPQQENLKRKYGVAWEEDYTAFTHRRLKAWGMNTLGNWSSPDFYLDGGTPYTVACHYKRPSIHEPDPRAHSNLPDVFHPDFRAGVFAAVARFTREAVDPWCIGFFIDNELPFAQPTTPAYKALLSPEACASRAAFLRRLQGKYGTVETLNAAWNTTFADWNALKPAPGKTPDAYAADMLEFSEVWFHEYYKTCRAAMREHAPNKLYLGSRINHWKNHLALNVCAEYADVVSINLYDYTPDMFRAPDGFDAPVLIGEFHFGTITERGVWGGGLCTAMDLDHAAELFQYYTGTALNNPLMVGAHWFKFSDQPLTGRKDGENYRIGFVDVTDTPYREMVDACRALAEDLYGWRMKGE
jgi:hypothetical protein